jgi:inhibitor of KinA sporulation pathway (predicted exonuclease)
LNFPGTQEVSTQTVAVQRLDDVIQASDLSAKVLMKIDVQGFELEVLKGATQTLTHVRWVYLEASFVELYEGQPLAAELVEFLRHAGFDFTGVHHISLSSTGECLQADLLFEARSARH